MAITAYNVVLSIHVMGVVIAFGVTFAYPIMFAIAARQDPRSLPLMHRIERTIDRVLINGALLIVLGAGLYLAAEGEHFKEFFVQWGIGAIIVIGALVGAVMIPTSKKAQETIERDLAAAGTSSAEGATLTPSEQYRKLARRLATVGSLLSVLVLVTIFIMATKP
jgi:drug/metabolite transporter (DMT)-like permease